MSTAVARDRRSNASAQALVPTLVTDIMPGARTLYGVCVSAGTEPGSESFPEGHPGRTDRRALTFAHHAGARPTRFVYPLAYQLAVFP